MRTASSQSGRGSLAASSGSPAAAATSDRTRSGTTGALTALTTATRLRSSLRSIAGLIRAPAAGRTVLGYADRGERGRPVPPCATGDRGDPLRHPARLLG